MSVWNKDKVGRVLRLQNLLERGFDLFESYDNAFIFSRVKNYVVVDTDYKELWSYKVK